MAEENTDIKESHGADSGITVEERREALISRTIPNAISGTGSLIQDPSIMERLLPMKTGRRVLQSYVLVSLDTGLDECQEDYRHSFAQLQSVVNTIDTYTDPEHCVRCLTEIQNENVFLIVSGALARAFIPCVHGLSQVDSIFISCQNKVAYEQWALEWYKIKGVFTRIDLVCDSLRDAAHICDHNSIPMSFIATTEASSSPKRIQIDPTFMYTQLLKEMLLDISFDEPKCIQELVDFSRSRCVNNPTELSKIEQFEHSYRDHSPIWWYTFECAFLYRTLNKALGHLEVDTLLKMGFFIQHLHRHIVKLHSEQQHVSDSHAAIPFSVYRGQGLSKDDFSQMKDSNGGLMSFNNFLSTSQERQVAMDFIERVRAKADKVPVLFVIAIDPSANTPVSSPFARVDQDSCFEAEREILFSMNSVFQIGEIKEMEDENKGLWQVALTLTDSDSDLEYAALINRLREENTGSTGWTRLGQLLIKLSKYDKAAELYETLITMDSDIRWSAHYYYMLGLTKFAQGEYQKAIVLYQKAVGIFQQDTAANLSDLASSHNNIGLVYGTTGDYLQALSFYEKALEIKKRLFPPNHPNLTSTYSNIGLLYYNMGDCTKALSFFEEAVAIQQAVLPSFHPDLAKSYRCVAMAYEKMGKWTASLEYYDKIIDIQEKSLPPNHPDLATSYNSLGEVHRNMGNYSKALSDFEQALKMKEKSLSPMDPAMIFSYKNIANVHVNIGNYSTALSFYEKAFEIQSKYFPSNHREIAASFMDMGNVHCYTGEYPMAVSYYERALPILEKIDPPNRQDLVTYYYNRGELYCHMENYAAALSSLQHCLEILDASSENQAAIYALPYHCLGRVYQSMNDCTTALTFYEKALSIREQTLPEKHPDLATTYSSVGDIHRMMGEYDKALSFLRQALDIQENVTCNGLDTAATYNIMGEVLREMVDYPSALGFLRKALEIREKLLPKNHLHLAVTHHNLAQVYDVTHESHLAMEHIKLAIDIGQQKLPEHHPHLTAYAKTLENIREKL